MSQQPIPRPTVRVLLLDESDRIFLLHAEGEFRGSGLPVWLPPGGGLEAGETYEQAAMRELMEEVGLSDVVLGACVWLRELPYVMADGVPRLKQERYYVARVPAFDFQAKRELDLEGLLGARWWTLAEIEACSDAFVPRALASLLRPILAGDVPDVPFAVEI